MYTANATVSYDGIGRVSGYLESGVNTAYTYLSMGMLRDQTVTSGSLSVQYHYEYEELSDDSLTGRVSGFSSAVKYGTTDKSSSDYAYTYDINGNILTISLNDVLKVSYEYDALNQLTRENNKFSNRTYTYTYDNAGNILTKKVFPYTTMVSEQLATAPAYSTYTYTYDNAGNITSKRTYAYTTGTVGSSESSVDYLYSGSGWGDQLTRHDGGSITYDSLGNPLTYYNGSSYTFTWENGRQLASVVGSSYNVEARSYEYNADGIRTRKVRQDGSSIEYVLDGSTILAQYDPVNGTFIQFRYDANGTPVAMILNGVTYLYEKNLQGDIIGIYDTDGNKIVTYVYDAWGNMVWYSTTSTSVWFYNPFRYRGYYWDSETGFYYLQSRYYDPATGRFLNADGHVNANGDLIGYNMYAYCSNNPVMNVDPSGEWTIAYGQSFSAFLFGGATYSQTIVIDSSGNIAIQKTKADAFKEQSGVTLGVASIGKSYIITRTNLDTYKDLEGWAYTVGASANVYGPISVGGEKTITTDGKYVGDTISLGAGVGVDVHATYAYTETVYHFNVFDELENLWNGVCDWFSSLFN